NYLLYSLFERLDLFYASLLDASILVLLYAVPLWFFVMRPMSGKKTPEVQPHRVLFLAVLVGIFLAEFLMMMGLPHIMTQSDNQSINLVDAFITTLLCAPILWWLTCSRKNRSSKVTADDMLSAPLRLFCLLLFAVFLTDLLMDILSAYLLPDVSRTSTIVVDAFLSTL